MRSQAWGYAIGERATGLQATLLRFAPQRACNPTVRLLKVTEEAQDAELHLCDVWKPIRGG
jgi:hypothetical protein